MSQENVRTVLETNAAFNRGDLDTYFESFDPDIEWHDLPTFPGVGVHHGQKAFRSHVEDWLEAWSEPRTEVASAVYDFRGGRVLRVRQFVDHAEAVEAAAGP